MNSDYRYEIKFVVNDIQLSEFYQWMWTMTSMKESYPGRMINSLYFDDVDYQSVKDNLAGLPNREKYRFRWYSHKDENEVVDLKLEKKVREGRLGYKLVQSLESLQDQLLSTDYRDLKSKSDAQFRKLGLLSENNIIDVVPTLHVNYFREYFRDINNIRITIDKDINFYNVDASEKLFQSRPISYSKKIIELKFSPDLKTLVSKLIKPMHLVPQRCSKYLHGLAMNGIVVYL